MSTKIEEYFSRSPNKRAFSTSESDSSFCQERPLAKKPSVMASHSSEKQEKLDSLQDIALQLNN